MKRYIKIYLYCEKVFISLLLFIYIISDGYSQSFENLINSSISLYITVNCVLWFCYSLWYYQEKKYRKWQEFESVITGNGRFCKEMQLKVCINYLIYTINYISKYTKLFLFVYIVK